MLRQFGTALFLTLLGPALVFSLECPPEPQQVSKDTQVQVDASVAKIMKLTGAQLSVQTKRTTQDLLGKLPGADRVYLEQMMYASFCSMLRDAKLSDKEKLNRLQRYNSEVRSTISGHSSKPVHAAKPTTHSQQQHNSGGTNVQQQSVGSSSPNINQGPGGSVKIENSSPQVSAPGGIAVGRDNYGSTTINNNGIGYGNLEERANNLANEIDGDMRFRGWMSNPPRQFKTPEEQMNWTRSMSEQFRFMRLKDVKKIRDEFAVFHFMDERLDQQLREIDQIDAMGRMLSGSPVAKNSGIDIILPQQMEDIAARLRILSKRISAANTRAPEQLPFAEQRIKPQEPKFPYEIVVAITPPRIVDEGYVVVEFDGQPANVSTDFKGSKLVFATDDLTNKDLAALLRSYTPIKYALEIGSEPLLPKNPVHVFAAGMKPIHVSQVILF